MFTKTQLGWIIWKAGESMEQDGNLDINHAAIELRMAAEKFLILLKYPESRPFQEKHELLMKTIRG